MVNTRQIMLICQQCQKNFRLTLENNIQISPIPCPSCGTPIQVKQEADVKGIFARNKMPRVFEAAPRPKIPQEKERDDTASRFTDVKNIIFDHDIFNQPMREDFVTNSKLSLKLQNDIPLPSNAPKLPESKSTRNLKKALRKKIMESNPTRDENLEGPHEKSEDNSELSSLVESKTLKEEPPLSENNNLEDEIKKQIPVSDLEMCIAEYDPQNIEDELVIRQGDNEVIFNHEKLKQLVLSQAWLGAFEAKLGEHWIPLHRHPAIPFIENELVEAAAISLVSLSQEIDRPININKSHEKEPTETFTTTQKFSKAVYILIPLFFIASIAFYFLVSEPEPEILPEPKPVEYIAPPEARENALKMISFAKQMTISTASLREKPPEILWKNGESSLSRANFGDALDSFFELHRRNPKNAKVLHRLVDAHMGSGQFRDARHRIVDLVTLKGQTKARVDIFVQTLARDRTLLPETIEIKPRKAKQRDSNTNVGVDQMKALGGGKSISFKFKRKGRNVFAFKPSQLEWEDGWRGEIAAYIFCEIATCGFNVPRSRKAKISRKNFNRLYPMNSDWQKSYAERFGDLRWKTEIVKGIKVEYLYGVLKNWIPRFVNWPIEDTDIWEKWLDPTQTIEHELPAYPALKTLAVRNPKLWKKLEHEMHLPIDRIAGELSSILSFDYLINNWDRFSAKEEFYGVNNQFTDGHFLSLDNGAGFGLRHSLRVEKRFQPIGRFSRSFVSSILLLDNNIDQYLFPNATKNEIRKMLLFHERRVAFIKIVQEKIKKHGKTNVLKFD